MSTERSKIRSRFLRIGSASSRSDIRFADICQLQPGDHVTIDAPAGRIMMGEEDDWTHEVVEADCMNLTAKLVCVRFDETFGTGDEETFVIDFVSGTIKRTSFACSPV